MVSKKTPNPSELCFPLLKILKHWWQEVMVSKIPRILQIPAGSFRFEPSEKKLAKNWIVFLVLISQEILKLLQPFLCSQNLWSFGFILTLFRSSRRHGFLTHFHTHPIFLIKVQSLLCSAFPGLPCAIFCFSCATLISKLLFSLGKVPKLEI